MFSHITVLFVHVAMQFVWNSVLLHQFSTVEIEFSIFTKLTFSILRLSLFRNRNYARIKMKPIVPVRVGRRFRHTLSRLYQPKVVQSSRQLSCRGIYCAFQSTRLPFPPLRSIFHPAYIASAGGTNHVYLKKMRF